MEESERANRRLRRRERTLLRRLQLAVPIALVIAAGLLSMGVIKVMEVPKPEAPEPAVAAEGTGLISDEEQRGGPSLDHSLLAARPDMLGTLGVSLLDDHDEVEAPVPNDSLEPAEHGSEDRTSPLPRVDAGPPVQFTPAPEPGSVVLLGFGLAGLAFAGRRRARASRRSR